MIIQPNRQPDANAARLGWPRIVAPHILHRSIPIPGQSQFGHTTCCAFMISCFDGRLHHRAGVSQPRVSHRSPWPGMDLQIFEEPR